MTPLEAARLFHDTYERLAPSFGYETRPDTKAFEPDSPNGKLMQAVCGEMTGLIAARYRSALETVKRTLETPQPAICCTVWADGCPAETLLDHVDAALANSMAQGQGEEG